MFEPRRLSGQKPRFYADLATELASLMDDYWLTNLANTAALLTQYLTEINWAGFYLLRGKQLALGPFQGKPACLFIPLGRGVCGTAALERRTLIVPDVSQFSGHIACDSASRSEIVVPLIFDGRLLGVMDIDSPITARFDDADRDGLEKLAEMLLSKTSWPDPFP